MVIVYLILGALLPTILYLLFQFKHSVHYNHLNYKSLLKIHNEQNQIKKNIFDINYLITQLDKQMKEDSYKSISETNQTIETLQMNFKGLVENFKTLDLSIQDSFKTVASNFSQINSQINTLQDNINYNR